MQIGACCKSLKIKLYTLLAVILFFLGTVFLSGRDNIVHGVHYDYGLQFSYEWATLDWAIYFFEFQVLVFACALVARSWKLLVFFEVFTLTATQDLFFYAWRGFAFPSGDWTWMPLYEVFGSYTTAMQITLSFTSLYEVIKRLAYQ
jgi:hypothetical protein